MNTDFSQIMSQRTDSELLNIVNKQKEDYQPEAVIAAYNELLNRNLSENQHELLSNQLELYISEKDSSKYEAIKESTKKSNVETNSKNGKGKSNLNELKTNISGFIINSLRNAFILAAALLIIFVVFKGWSISEVLSRTINNGEGLLVLIVLGAAYEIFKIFKL